MILRRSLARQQNRFPVAALLSAAGGGAGTGSLDATLGALTVAATGVAPVVGTLSGTLGALTLSATGTVGSTPITGSLTATLGALTVAAQGYILTSATVGGVLTVDGTNGRYFRNTAGIVMLSGFHTWASIQDSWPSLPITALDFDEYLAALVSYGCNFTKAWILESAKDWGDSVQYFVPLPWARTGPGNAHDGRLKFDLTQFDASYFARLRERCIRLGNAGIYVCVQLFQGWHVSKKGFNTGDPWANHPMASANNINGVNGDTNGDVVGLETRTTSLTATYNIQKAYVEHVIDTLNDLDNVFWEISNEEENSSLTWQRALVDYIQTYEAGKPKQHLVGMTVCWPSGDNQDLYDTTTIAWLSPGGDFVPETASAAKVSAFDTDHVGGLTSGYKWIFQALCQGHGGTWYMDEWAGETYGADRRSNATYQKIRAILGYARERSQQIDLAHATPQPSLASTGYCLAKTSGTYQFLAYQDTSGSFTLNLTSYAGTFSVEWLRTANGATQAGSNISGGASRTLTPPWAGEDAVALVELIAINGSLTATLGTLTVSAAGSVAVTGSLAGTLGTLTVTAAAVAPVVGALSATLGALTVSAAGVVAVTGTLAGTLDALTSSATGVALVAGSAAVTLGALTLAAAGTVAVTGALTGTLDALTLTALGFVGEVPIQGTLTATLGELTLAATGIAPVTGTVDATLGSLTLAATGVAPVTGAAAVTLGALVVAATGTVAVTGGVSVTLGELVVSASGYVGDAPAITGYLNVTLGELTAAGAGVVLFVTTFGRVVGPGGSGTVRGPRASATIGV